MVYPQFLAYSWWLLGHPKVIWNIIITCFNCLAIAASVKLKTYLSCFRLLCLDKPEIKEGASAQNIMSWINHKTEIMCEAEGVPVPEITWSRKGTVTSSKEFSSRVSTLTFTPQELRDFGAYVCQARNLLGSMEKRIIIEMLGKLHLRC